MKLGNITRRGKHSWRIKVELPRDPETGERRAHFETVRGKREDAKAKLIEIAEKLNKGEHVDQSAVTVEGYIKAWLEAPAGLSPKTAERYRELAENQIYPHVGAIRLQKLDTSDLQDWHGKLLAAGRKDGKPLHPRTVGHAHRVLHRALNRAVEGRKVFRNVAAIVKPPKVEDDEMVILTADQIGAVLAALQDHPLHPIVLTALGAGLRRGEVAALTWNVVDLDGGWIKVERSVEETRAGLRFKAPKTRHGRRKVPMPPTMVEALRGHRKAQLEIRMALGLGKRPDDALVFPTIDGGPMSPDNLSRDWRRFVRAKKLPEVSFHALRHTHVSALIDGGLDVFQISRRIGHGSAALTLRVYGHLFSKKDTEAVEAIESALKG